MTATAAITIDPPHLHFEAGLVGFPQTQRYQLLESEHGILALQGVAEDDPDFVVVAPEAFFPDYAPVIDDEAVERLGLTSAQDAMVLLVVTLGPRPEDATANLLAPLVVNVRTREAAQVVLGGQDQPLRAPLLHA